MKQLLSIITIIIFSNSLFAQFSVEVGGHVSSMTQQLLMEKRGPHMVEKPEAHTTLLGGFQLKLRYKKRFALETGVSWTNVFTGFRLDHPRCQGCGQTTGVVTSQYHSLLFSYKQPLFKVFKRPVYAEFALGGGFAINTSYDDILLNGGTFEFSVPISGGKMTTALSPNHKLVKAYGVLEGRVGLGVDILDWLSVSAHFGYIHGLEPVVEAEGSYQATGEPKYYGKSLSKGRGTYIGLSLGFRIWRDKKAAFVPQDFY